MDPATGRPLSQSSPVHRVDPDVFSDEYAMTDHEVEGDHTTPTISREVSSASRASRSSALIQQASDVQRISSRRCRLSQRSNVRSSILSSGEEPQPRYSHRPLSEVGRINSNAPQSIRSVSTMTIPRAQSPYQGATGPSQPYSMYRQDVSVTRTPSVATNSTVRGTERTYSGPGVPTQPYGLYAQNTVPEDDQMETGAPIPGGAGFSGLSPDYRRRLGPEGEDADDLIGPDGYTEQLPPYTRYANGIPPKGESTTDFHPDIPAYIQQRASTSQPQGARREVDEEHVSPISPSPTTGNPFDEHPENVISPAATDSMPSKEALSFRDRVKARGTIKVCCGLIPCWLLVTVVILLCLAILLGGVVGGAVAHHGNFRPPSPPPSESPLAAA